MSNKSKITWTDETWNPIVGCSKCSPGCDHCYAERMAARLAAIGIEKYNSVITDGSWNGSVCFENALSVPTFAPKFSKKTSKIFICSMGDIFHNCVKSYWIDIIISKIEKYPSKTFIMLTKRPENMKAYFEGKNIPKNLWLGVTVCNQDEANKKIPILLQISSSVRFISVEPMLGEIDLERGGFSFLRKQKSPSGKTYEALDWVICGGESGPRARPMHPDWVRSLRDQCKAAGTPFLFKQWGEWTPNTEWAKPGEITPSMARYLTKDGKMLEIGKGLSSLSETILTHKPGKKRAGRLLDGEIHDQYPEVSK